MLVFPGIRPHCMALEWSTKCVCPNYAGLSAKSPVFQETLHPCTGMVQGSKTTAEVGREGALTKHWLYSGSSMTWFSLDHTLAGAAAAITNIIAC